MLTDVISSDVISSHQFQGVLGVWCL